ncbi:Pfs, NACHT and ankyrin domain protein [Aureobasidium subglaciale]|nr:Pfs, NACHT and ankyrin domain protein [Aureobasidium subglaciale]
MAYTEYVVSKNLDAMHETTLVTGQQLVDLQEQKQMSRIMKWLDPSAPSTNYNKALQLGTEGTGIWFTHGDAFRQWKERPKAFLWLHGIPGCGKTVLSSTIIEYIMQETDGQVLLYFYFVFNDNSKQTLESVLRSLISQFLHKQPYARQWVQNFWPFQDGGGKQPTISQLQSVLKVMLGKVRAIIVLDALDEAKPRSELLCWLKTLIESDLSYRLLITSRKEEDIDVTMGRCTRDGERISIQSSDVDKDIHTYVKDRIINWDKLRRWRDRQDIQSHIETKLMGKTAGMRVQSHHCWIEIRFRWAACQIEALAKCYDQKKLLKALNDLPRTLNETYARILQEISEDNRKDATTILRLLTWSERPLRLEEMVDALAIQPDEEPNFDIDNRMPEPRDILRIASSLISLVQIPANDDQNEEARYWMNYAKDAENKGNSSWKMVWEFFQQEQEAVTLSFGLYDPDDPNNEDAAARKTPLGTPLYYASLEGTSKGVAFMLGKGVDVNARGGSSGSALNAASVGGHLEIVQTLLRSSAEVGIPSTSGNILNEVAAAGHDKVVELLLDCGADVHARGFCYSALEAASRHGQVKVVEILLDNDADVNAQDEIGCPLHAAIGEGHFEIALMLLSKGANPNGYGPLRLSVLQAASKHGSKSVVQALLDKGADVNAKRYLGSPLQLASRDGHHEIVQLPLDNGADMDAIGQVGGRVNQKNRYGRAPKEAITGSHEETVKLLLDNGAQVLPTLFKVTRIDPNETDVLRLLLPHLTAELMVVKDSQNSKTILHWTANMGQQSVIQRCLDLNTNVHATDKDGRTALHYAVEHAGLDIVKTLVEAGSNKTAIDSRGRTPLDYARERLSTQNCERFAAIVAYLEYS